MTGFERWTSDIGNDIVPTETKPLPNQTIVYNDQYTSTTFQFAFGPMTFGLMPSHQDMSLVDMPFDVLAKVERTAWNVVVVEWSECSPSTQSTFESC